MSFYRGPGGSGSGSVTSTPLPVGQGGTGAQTAQDARTNLAVTKTGEDTTYAFRANNLSDLNSASTARTNLGLGTIATQDASNVSITGGSVAGITDLAVADGGTGASTAANARVNLLPSYTSNANKVLAINSGATDVEWITAGAGTVTSVDMSVPTGLAVSGNPVTTSGTLAVSFASGYSIPTTSKQTDWDTAYTDRLKWDGGATGLDASTGRTSLGLGTIATQASSSVSITGGSISGITDLAVADGGTGASTAANARINLLPSYTGNGNKVLSLNSGATDVEWTTNGAGTVTSVDMTVPTGLVVANNPITSSGTLAITFASGYSIPTTTSQTNWDTAYTDRLKWDGGATGLDAATGRTSLGLGTAATTASTDYAPAAKGVTNGDSHDHNGGDGAQIAYSSLSGLPTLGTIASQAANNVAITGGSITGITDLAIADGGTGASTAQAAINALAGAVTSGSYLRGNGTNVVMSTIQAGDVPTLNQNTTGTASNVTGTIAVANGGTGATTQAGARTGLGATTVGSNVFTLTNPSAVTFIRMNADNTVTARSASELKTDLSLNNVENTALSTWAGSSNITTVGTVSTGTISGGTYA